MDSADRTDLIVSRLRETGEVTVTELAELTDHSEMTIRRDLDQLAAQGVLRRVRGGAVSLVPRGQEAPYALRERQSAEAKRRIAAAVGELIGPGSAVVLGGGTTAAEVARVLAGRAITVMPLGLQAAQLLSADRATKVLMAGGEVRPTELSLHGPLAEASLDAVRFDVAVLGCCGITVGDGITAHDLGEVAVERAAMRSSRRTVLAADSTKLGQVTMGRVGPVTAIDTLVTDSAAPDGIVADLQAAGVTVVRA
ncbi:DeoR/GlpR family transcriptional regulator of sugar metabolism [Nocardiopsis mwathae]|uniref:DeoR/GlpR family transcriptional regulator of sugar metabolism n=1 Tax=Nocardiopsis mwathae TaxID=1472723 RepID=A0A7W9YFV8_9ACTN|nr:DeoR/GlpR family DNA-binding transcription regulator [Nocardiopsis mwathae]MBB6171414.1 DeoR/GlpR family transcriptional regulator of sugar metabolism [Nocardiopsis mwathae]